MPKDYITKNDLKEFMEEQRTQFERNVGAMAENFLDQVKMLAEGVQMQVEKVEMFRIENNDDHDKFNSRIARLEAKTINF